MPYVDFAELKSRISIERTVSMLSLSLNKAGAQPRGPCPVCNAGGDRALVVTPEKGLFYCFAAKTGGDQIALAAHIKGLKTGLHGPTGVFVDLKHEELWVAIAGSWDEVSTVNRALSPPQSGG